MGGVILGSLCTGYGGLDLAVELALGPVQHAWHAELDPDASKVLAAHWAVPNLGDLRAVDWSAVPPVDVLTAGFPCQPVSAAGQRKGVDDERWLFDDIADAVGRMDPRPRLLVLENVRGLLTANGGDAMARVVQGLAALGYVGRYRLLGADEVGAAHQRKRVFFVAWLAADANGSRRREVPGGAPGYEGQDAGRHAYGDHLAGGTGARELPPAGLSLLPTPAARLGERWGAPNVDTAARRMYDEGRRTLEDAVALLPTPTARDHKGANQRGDATCLPGALLPTPRTSDVRGAGIHGDEPRPAVLLLPTPTVVDAKGGRNATAGRSADASDNWSPGWTLSDVAYADRWGEYGPAIRRWERVVGRPAPDPTEPGTKGQPRLAPAFVEWLMGIPAGWVTDHLGRNPALRVLGNGVVPQQAAAAIRALVDVRTEPGR